MKKQHLPVLNKNIAHIVLAHTGPKSELVKKLQELVKNYAD